MFVGRVMRVPSVIAYGYYRSLKGYFGVGPCMMSSTLRLRARRPTLPVAPRHDEGAVKITTKRMNLIKDLLKAMKRAMEAAGAAPPVEAASNLRRRRG